MTAAIRYLVLLAGCLLASCVTVGTQPPLSGNRQLGNIGVQLYTVRAEMQSDFEGTLRRIAAIGYDEVEFAGLYGRDPVQVRKLLDELKMNAPASHIGWERIRDEPAAAIAETKALGATYMVIAWLPPEERDSLEDWDRWITRLNAVGKLAQEAGIQLVYHNHDFEFAPIDGVRPYDRLLQELDPDLVEMELDLYWMTLGGANITALINQAPGRFILMHVKDMKRNEAGMADVGTGRIDFAAIFAENEKAGVAHVFVEHDTTDDPCASLASSLAYLRNLRY